MGFYRKYIKSVLVAFVCIFYFFMLDILFSKLLGISMESSYLLLFAAAQLGALFAYLTSNW